jgi:hypothetical protein
MPAGSTTPDLLDLNALFWEHHERKLISGKVELYKGFLRASRRVLESEAAPRRWQGVVVACDPDNLGVALAFDLQHNFLGNDCARKSCCITAGLARRREGSRAREQGRSSATSSSTTKDSPPASPATALAVNWRSLAQRAGVSKVPPSNSSRWLLLFPDWLRRTANLPVAAADFKIDRREIARSFAEED